MSNNGARINATVQNGSVAFIDQTVSTCTRQEYTLRASLVAADGTPWALTAVVTVVSSASRRTCCSGGSVQGTLVSVVNPPGG